MAKSIEQWRDEIEDLRYGVRICLQELNMARSADEDPFVVVELEAAWRGALARLAERQRRFAAWQTLMANNALRRGETDRL